jgi:hypothetical protein
LIAEELLQHVTTLRGATIWITLNVEANVRDGVSDDVQRMVIERPDPEVHFPRLRARVRPSDQRAT